MSLTGGPIPAWRRRALIFAAVLLAAEFLIIGLLFKHFVDFDCRANWPGWACGRASKSLAALYCVIAALALFSMLRPFLFRSLLSDAGRSKRPLITNAIGFCITLAPAWLLQDGTGARMLGPAFTLWIAGMVLILAGLMLYLARPGRWHSFLVEGGAGLGLAIGIGAAAPMLAVKLQPIWRMNEIADVTFRAVSWLIGLFGYDVFSDPGPKIIGDDSFRISVAPVCSGVEGIALVTLFVSLYLWLFRAELRFPRALLLYPAGILASAALNIVRITLLLILGLEGHPELAVGGFHSHAGWVMFTLVALGVIAFARGIPALNKDPSRASANALPPLRRDLTAAQILPFAVFMLTAVVAPALSQSPAMLYPIRVIFLACATGIFWQLIRGLPWRPALSAPNILVGAVVGLGWIVVPVPSAEGLPYGNIQGVSVTLWYIFRGIGTTLLVPLVEEMFFRGYLEGRIRGSALEERRRSLRALFAAVITAALFAALHDRYIEAFVAGLAFSFVAWRGGRITDSVVAHGVANLIVFVAAVLMGRFEII